MTDALQACPLLRVIAYDASTMTSSSPTSQPDHAAGHPAFWRLIADVFIADWAPTKRFALAGSLWLVTIAMYVGFMVRGFVINNPDRWFQEGQPGTILSGIVLFVAAARSHHAYRCIAERAARRFWFVLAIALLIAGIDDLFKLHEHIEIWFHQIFGLERSNSPYDFDDYLVMAYPLIVGLFALPALRHVLSSTSTVRWWFFGGLAFILMFAVDSGMASIPTPYDGAVLWEELAKSFAGASVMAGVLSAIEPGTPRLR